MPRLTTLLAAFAAAAVASVETARGEPPATAPLPGHGAESRAASGASPEAVRLAERYLQDAEAQKILDGEGPVIAQYMISKIPEPAGGPQKADEVRHAMLDAANAAVAAAIPQFLHESAEVYARVFTLAELKDIVAFYDSPAGKAFVAKTGEASQPIAELIRGLGDQIQVDTRRRFCAKEPESCRSAASPETPPRH